MLIEFVDGDVQFAVLAELGPGRTDAFVLCEFLGRELLAAVLTGLLGMEVLIVLLEVVDIDHLLAQLTPLDVASAVSKMTVDFGLGKVLAAVIALFDWLHRFQLFE